MKIFYLPLILLALAARGYSQDSNYKPDIGIDPVSQRIVFKGEIPIGIADKLIAYKRARAWFNRTYGQHNCFVTMADRSTGKLIGRATGYGKLLKGLTSDTYQFQYNVFLKVNDKSITYLLTDYVEVRGYNFSEKSIESLPCDIYLQDKKYHGSDGQFNSYAKHRLYYLEGTSKYLINSLKSDLASNEFDAQLSDDGF